MSLSGGIAYVSTSDIGLPESSASGGYWMTKFGLVPQTLGVVRLQTRMRAWVVDGRFTFQVWEPPLLLGTLEKSVVHVPPPSRDS